MRRRRIILLSGFVARMEGTTLPEVRDAQKTGGGVGCERGKIMSEWGVSWMTSELRYHHRRVDDFSPGRREMAHNGTTRGGAFHSGMDRCRESQGWIKACSSMPIHHEKDRGEDSPKRTESCWFAHYS